MRYPYCLPGTLRKLTLWLRVAMVPRHCVKSFMYFFFNDPIFIILKVRKVKFIEVG